MSERPQTPEAFIQHLAQVTATLGTAELGPDLQDRLNVQFPTGSAHNPTVAGGKALVLYLLPGGAIEFTND